MLVHCALFLLAQNVALYVLFQSNFGFLTVLPFSRLIIQTLLVSVYGHWWVVILYHAIWLDDDMIMTNQESCFIISKQSTMWNDIEAVKYKISEKTPISCYLLLDTLARMWSETKHTMRLSLLLSAARKYRFVDPKSKKGRNIVFGQVIKFVIAWHLLGYIIYRNMQGKAKEQDPEFDNKTSGWYIYHCKFLRPINKIGQIFYYPVEG